MCYSFFSHNMKQKKNSNVAFKLKQTLFFSTNFRFFSTSQNNMSTNNNHKCSAFFFSFPIYSLSIFLKNVRFFLSLFFSYVVFNGVQVSFPFLFVFFHCPVPFFLFLNNKLLIHYPFFFQTLYLPLSVFLSHYD